jgi:hypothetical protein
MSAIGARTARLHSGARTMGAGIAATILMLTSAASGEVTAPQHARTSFPSSSTTGVPSDWEPTATYTKTLRISERGTVLEDVRLLNADLVINADNATVRRVGIQAVTSSTMRVAASATTGFSLRTYRSYGRRARLRLTPTRPR